MPVVNVIARTVYGRTMYYPNSPAAHALVSIDGAKTLTHKHFEAAKALGMMVELSDGVTVDRWLDVMLAAQSAS